LKTNHLATLLQIRQASYCKILNDLERTEESIMKSEPESTTQVQTITINGQQYQIVSPASDTIQVWDQC
jgi:hypothetical protein